MGMINIKCRIGVPLRGHETDKPPWEGPPGGFQGFDNALFLKHRVSSFY